MEHTVWRAVCFLVTLHSGLGALRVGASGLTWPAPYPPPHGLFQREEVPLHECLIDDRAMPLYSTWV